LFGPNPKKKNQSVLAYKDVANPFFFLFLKKKVIVPRAMANNMSPSSTIIVYPLVVKGM